MKIFGAGCQITNQTKSSPQHLVNMHQSYRSVNDMETNRMRVTFEQTRLPGLESAIAQHTGSCDLR